MRTPDNDEQSDKVTSDEKPESAIPVNFIRSRINQDLQEARLTGRFTPVSLLNPTGTCTSAMRNLSA